MADAKGFNPYAMGVLRPMSMIAYVYDTTMQVMEFCGDGYAICDAVVSRYCALQCKLLSLEETSELILEEFNLSRGMTTCFSAAFVRGNGEKGTPGTPGS